MVAEHRGVSPSAPRLSGAPLAHHPTAILPTENARKLAEFVPTFSWPRCPRNRHLPPYTRARGAGSHGPPARLVDRDLFARHRALAHPRAGSRDRRGLLLLDERAPQRVHGRVPGAEPLS